VTERGRSAARGALALGCGLLFGCGEPVQNVGGEPASDPAAQEPAGPPERGDWLVLHLLSDPENLNPLTSSDAAASSVLRWIFPSLLTLDNETLEQRPVIASGLPLIADDKLSYTFSLRKDVTFSDGTPLTAEDVLFTLKATKNPAVLAPHTRGYFLSVRDAVAVDRHTVRIELRERYFRNDLVLGGIQPLPRHYYDPHGLMQGLTVGQLDQFDDLDKEGEAKAREFAKAFNRDFQRRPMGPGAFELRNPERDIVTGEKIVLNRRTDFWAADDPVFGDAWVNKIVFRVINDTEASLTAFKGGKLDRIGLTPLQYNRPDTQTAKFEKRASKHIHVSPGYTYIGWNQKNQLFRDRELRNALRYFVNKQEIIDKVLYGLGVPVESPIFVERPEYKRDLPAHEFNPDKGKALLDAAGWIDKDGDGVRDKTIDGLSVPLRFEIISNSGNSTRKAVGLTVIDEMKRGGIDASFREIDWSIMLSKVKTFDYDAVILGWAMSVVVPDSFQIWHSSQAVEGGSNHVFFRNEEVDEILVEYRVEFDPEKRKQMYDRFQEILYHEQPYAFLFMGKAISTWDRRFRGVNWYPSGGTDMGEWWVPAAQQKYGQ
jgi:peptide/nickel transport system substrate-binding protein